MKSYAATTEKPEFFNIIDIARRVAGTGSLGLERFAILVEGRGGVGGHFMLDLMQAFRPALAEKLYSQPQWQSESARVAAVGSRMQAVPPAFLEAVEINGEAFLLKGLQPSQDRVNLEGAVLHPKQLDRLMCEFGAVAAWAQLVFIGARWIRECRRIDCLRPGTQTIERVIGYRLSYGQTVENDWHAFTQCGAGIDSLIKLSI